MRFKQAKLPDISLTLSRSKILFRVSIESQPLILLLSHNKSLRVIMYSFRVSHARIIGCTKFNKTDGWPSITLSSQFFVLALQGGPVKAPIILPWLSFMLNAVRVASELVFISSKLECYSLSMNWSGSLISIKFTYFVCNITWGLRWSYHHTKNLSLV